MIRRGKYQTSRAWKEVKNYKTKGTQSGSNVKSEANVENVDLVSCLGKD